MSQPSITLKEAQKHIDKFSNEHLYNFLAQRVGNKSEMAEYAWQVANDRLMKEHAMLWKGQKFKDEPLQDIIDRKTKESQDFINDHIEIVHIK